MDSFLRCSVLDSGGKNKEQQWKWGVMAPQLESRCSRPLWSALTPTPYLSGLFSLYFPLTHTALPCCTLNVLACPTWGPSHGLVPLPGMFFTQKSSWLTTSPLTNFCSNVTVSARPILTALLITQPVLPPRAHPTLLCFFSWHFPSWSIPCNISVHVHFVGLALSVKGL